MTLTEINERLEKVENAIWYLEMADLMTMKERDEYRKLVDERSDLLTALNEVKKPFGT